MDSNVDDLNAIFSARRQQIAQLYNIYGSNDDFLIDSVYVFGCTSTGKSSVVGAVLEKTDLKYCVINLVECYSTKVLLEKILNVLSGHRVDPLDGRPYARCDNLMDFLKHLKILTSTLGIDKLVIVLDKAENLRSMDQNLLPAFTCLRKLTGLIQVSTIFISELPFEKFYGFNHISEPKKVYFPQYNKEELLEILSKDISYFRDVLAEDFPFVDFLTVDFLKNYLNVFLSVFYRSCRDLSELRHNARLNFVSYCDPIFTKNCNPKDPMKLWRFIAPTLKSCLEGLYSRMIANLNGSCKENLARTIELPFYAKYLLVAAYLASYNSPSDDKRLFVKHHGKKRKTKGDLNRKKKVSEKLNTQLGPKSFNLDRLIAVFCSIVDDKIPLTHNLFVQVTTLVELKLLLLVTENVGIDSYKYKCNVSFDFITDISKMIDFDIKKYLMDFN